MKKHLWIAISFLVLVPLRADDTAGRRASLWQPNAMVNSMYSDPKARAVNDIVIIKISETSSASNTAGVSTSKKSSNKMGVDAFLGLETSLKGKIVDGFDPANMFSSSTANSNVGTGTSTRESALSAYIAARVIDVMPGGNLTVEARKEIMVNHEKQTVVLRGLVRPRDIGYDNIVESSRIADMQINFAGKGPASEQTKRGWLSWILSTIWPF